MTWKSILLAVDAGEDCPRRTELACDLAGEIIAVAEETSAGLIVAGGYGHARLREAVLGGVTQELLIDAPVCVLFSH